MAFKGMDTEAGLEVATFIDTTGSEILDIIDSVTSVVTSVEWIGPDYDQYTSDWNSFVSGPVAGLVEAISAKAEELRVDAEEQDTASNGQ
ncbi:hypothetical protein [Brachybacterium phenoliresistens]|nr:hypothetical protein [Brachybacterium phenoliresistens]